MKGITNLTEFAKYAERNSEEAFRLFRSEEFRSLIPEEDHKGIAMWRGLTSAPVTPDAMEEFLVGMRLKETTQVGTEEDSAEFWALTDSVQETLTLKRTGRGSFSFKVYSDCDFLEFPRTRITDADFVGSSYNFEYRILIGKLGTGVRTGDIFFESPCRSFRFRVSASRAAKDYKEGRAEVDRNLLTLQKLRLNYMLGKCTRAVYVADSLRCIETHYCISTDFLTEMRLYQAYLEKLKGNTQDAAAILREFRTADLKDEETEVTLSCLYLKGLIGEEDIPAARTASKVRSRFDRDGSSYLIMKLLFLTNPDIGRYPRRRKKAAEQVFERGCRSPLLYAELLRDLRQNDTLVTSLNDLVVQTLLFAAKHGLLTENLALRAAYLSANEKFFSEPLLRVLTAAYETWPADGILEAIVRLLMKGQPRDGKCFPWYALAVERGIKVIRLYEYYIETMPDNMQDPLPLPLRKYFLYNNTLSMEGRAAVYANIVRNRAADPGSYEAYEKSAEEFAYESLSKGCISENYAVLYIHFIRSIRDEESAKTLSRLLFTSRVYVEDADARSAAVVHDGLKEIRTSPLIRGAAYVLIFTGDAQILFENASGERFFTRAAYNVTPVCKSDFLLELLRAHEVPDEGFLLHELRAAEGHSCRTAREFELWRSAAESEYCTSALKREARKKVLEFILDHPESNFFHHGTAEDVLSLYAKADRSALVQVLLAAGLYKEAYGILLRSGIEGVPQDRLVSLSCRMIEECGGVKDPELVTFTAKVFSLGTYDERMLAYLTDHFRGEMDDMLSIRKRAAEFYIDTFPLDDRILSLSVAKKINIPEGPAILRDYEKHGGRRKLIRDYLEFRSDAILGSDEKVSDVVARCISNIYDQDEPMDFAMKLALLKYYSQNPPSNAHEEMQADLLMEECVKRNLRFAFMKNLPDSFVRQYRLDDCVFVETRARLDAEVLITYTLKNNLTDEEQPERTEMLMHRFRGIFSKEFTLFYGEILTYHLTVKSGGMTEVLEEKTLTAPPASLSGMGSYQRIGRMLKAAEDRDEEALIEEMCGYFKAKHAAEVLFALEETV